MIQKLKAACFSCKGKIRSNNEDNFFFCNEYLAPPFQETSQIKTTRLRLKKKTCFAVFDGMGGEAFGEVASLTAATALKKIYDQKIKESASLEETLFEICGHLNSEVCVESRKLNVSAIGTTAAMLLFSPDSVCCCNIGDSRIYRLRDGKLTQLSVDHIEKLPKTVMHKRKPGLTQHLGIFPDEMIIEPYIKNEPFYRKDIFLICSDGVTDMVGNEDICACLKSHVKVKKKVEQLVDLAMQNGGRDNITAIIIEMC